MGKQDNDLHKVKRVCEASGLIASPHFHANLAQLIKTARIEAVGWTWAEACVDVNNGLDIRKRNIPSVLECAETDLGDCAAPSGTSSDSRKTFYDELTQLLNRTSQEKFSNTPDFVLSEYLVNCLHAYELAIKSSEKLQEIAHTVVAKVEDDDDPIEAIATGVVTEANLDDVTFKVDGENFKGNINKDLPLDLPTRDVVKPKPSLVGEDGGETTVSTPFIKEIKKGMCREAARQDGEAPTVKTINRVLAETAVEMIKDEHTFEQEYLGGFVVEEPDNYDTKISALLKARDMLNAIPVSKVNRKLYCSTCDAVHQVTDEDGNAIALAEGCDLRVTLKAALPLGIFEEEVKHSGTCAQSQFIHGPCDCGAA